MKKLHPLRIKRKEKLTKEAAAISFDIPDELKEMFKYKQGQFLSLQIEIGGERFRREYSLCSSPYYDKDHVIASKIIGNGIVSNYIYNVLKEGDVIEVYPPQGKFFTELNPENEKTYILIGGGSGITPLYSILKSVLFAESGSKVILYFGNASEDSVMFKKDLDELAAANRDRFKIYYTLSEPTESWSGLKGMVNREDLMKIVNEIPEDERVEGEYFVCGPEVMMELVKETLIANNIPPDKIHIEYFTAPVLHHEEYIPAGEEDDVIKDREVKIILDGNEYNVNVPPGRAILDAAIDADLDPPFSCKSGICTTCRAKLNSGKVKMDEREGLSDSEIEEGYILTCQSHPLTDNVKLEYM